MTVVGGQRAAATCKLLLLLFFALLAACSCAAAPARRLSAARPTAAAAAGGVCGCCSCHCSSSTDGDAATLRPWHNAAFRVRSLPAAHTPFSRALAYSPTAGAPQVYQQHVDLLERRLRQRTQPPAACAARYGSRRRRRIGETSVCRVARASAAWRCTPCAPLLVLPRDGDSISLCRSARSA
jgi:hypothetical protein